MFPSQAEEKGTQREGRDRGLPQGPVPTTGQGTAVFWSFDVWDLRNHSWKNPGRRKEIVKGAGKPYSLLRSENTSRNQEMFPGTESN